MKLGDANYDKLVDRLRGNISSVKMTPEETQAEIQSIQGGAVSRFAGEVVEIPPGDTQEIWEAYEESRERNKDKQPGPGTHLYKCKTCGGIFPNGSGHIHSLGEPKKRRGRPPGSKNRPKGS